MKRASCQTSTKSAFPRSVQTKSFLASIETERRLLKPIERRKIFLNRSTIDRITKPRIRSQFEQNVLPFDLAWAPSIDQQSLAPQIFAFSLFPYLGFLYFLTRSKKSPPLMLFGFYFLLVFVAVSIPAGIYAKVYYGTSLSNVDWLHGSAESFLCITNLLIGAIILPSFFVKSLLLVLGLRQGIRKAYQLKKEKETNEGSNELSRMYERNKGKGGAIRINIKRSNMKRKPKDGKREEVDQRSF